MRRKHAGAASPLRCPRHAPWRRRFNLVLAGGLLLPPSPRASDIFWDGTYYVPVPMQLGADTRLVMPEAFDDTWERDADVACSLLDERTLIIRPRQAQIDQRLTLRGRRSGTLYLAHVSSRLPYTPLVVVHNLLATVEQHESDRPQADALGLVRAMMRGQAPAGYRVQKSQRVLAEPPPLRIVAEQLWRSTREAGLVARITWFPGASDGSYRIDPTELHIRIPALGRRRAFGADRFALDGDHSSTRVYLVYAAE